MPRPTWKGQIAFGLVNVPVTVYTAERRADVSFHLIDSRNAARVRYERVNEETGKEVPWDAIVKGYEYDKGNYVLFSEKELESASPELTRTIEIEQFVDFSEIQAVYLDRPYYVVPSKGGEKGYILLREAMKKSGKVGIAQVVIRTRQYLAALKAEENALVLLLLRFAQEIVPLDEFDVPGRELKKYKITQKEIDLAGQLIDGMTQDWDPKSYHDEYRDALMKLIDKKVSSGKTEEIAQPEEIEEEQAETINFMDVLKESLEKKGSRKRQSSSKKKKSRKSQAG